MQSAQTLTLDDLYTLPAILRRRMVHGNAVLAADENLTQVEIDFLKNNKAVYDALWNGVINLVQLRAFIAMDDLNLMDLVLSQKISFAQAQALTDLKQRGNIECETKRVIGNNQFYRECASLGFSQAETKALIARFSFTQLQTLIEKSNVEYVKACKNLGLSAVEIIRLQDMLSAKFMMMYVLSNPATAKGHVQRLLSLNENDVNRVKATKSFNLLAYFKYGFLSLKEVLSLPASESKFLTNALMDDDFLEKTGANGYVDFRAEYAHRKPYKEDQSIINLVAGLNKYIARIDGYPNLETGFKLFKKSQAANRKANLKFAKDLMNTLRDFDGDDTQAFLSETLSGKTILNHNVSKMHSKELNDLIAKAKAGKFAEINLQEPSKKRKLRA